MNEITGLYSGTVSEGSDDLVAEAVESVGGHSVAPKIPSLIGSTERCSKAACRRTKLSPDFFEAFDGEGTPSQTAAAKKICLGCEVIKQCLGYALANEKYVRGIWGGRTESERKLTRAILLRTLEK